MNLNAVSSLPIFMVLLALLFAGNLLAGQQPQAPIPVPEIVDVGDPPKSKVKDSSTGPQSKIRDVLRGNQPAPTGDGVLEDVLGVIQRQGSVLDGSLLDAQSLPKPILSGEDASKPNAVTQRALVAEQLLRAARMLEEISVDDVSKSLVASMRRQAGALLTAGESPNR